MHKVEQGGAHATRIGPSNVTRQIFMKLRYTEIQYTGKCGPAQINGFHYPVLAFYAESDSVNTSYRVTGRVHYIILCPRLGAE